MRIFTVFLMLVFPVLPSLSADNRPQPAPGKTIMKVLNDEMCAYFSLLLSSFKLLHCCNLGSYFLKIFHKLTSSLAFHKALILQLVTSGLVVIVNQVQDVTMSFTKLIDCDSEHSDSSGNI